MYSAEISVTELRSTRFPTSLGNDMLTVRTAVSRSSQRSASSRKRLFLRSPREGLRGFIAKFTVLKGAQRELWLTFLIKFLIYTAYSVTNKTMVLVAVEGSRLQRSGGRSAGRLGLGAGNDRLHFARRLAHGRDRVAPDFFPRRRDLHRRSQRDGVTTIPWLALACGVLPLAVGEALGHAGVAGGDAALLHDSAAFDLVLDHLHE